MFSERRSTCPALNASIATVRSRIVVDPHPVEVVGPLAGRQIARPPVRVALEHHVAAHVERGDAVRAGADRRVGQRAGEIASGKEMLRQHRQAADQQRQLAVGVGAEVEHHAAFAGHLDVLDVGELDAEGRPALRQQGAIGPGDVRGGDRGAVGEFRRRIEVEGHPQPAVRQLDGLRQMAIAGGRLVGRGGQQALPHMPDRGTGARPARQDHPGAGHAERRGAAQDERVEIVERAAGGQPHLAALGRVRIDVGEIGKVGRQCGLAEHRDGVAACHRVVGGAGTRAGQAEQHQQRDHAARRAGARGGGARGDGAYGGGARGGGARAAVPPRRARRIAWPPGIPAVRCPVHRHQAAGPQSATRSIRARSSSSRRSHSERYQAMRGAVW